MRLGPELHFVFALTDGGGTVPPELEVVRRLVERGHHVQVLGEPSMTVEMRRTGAELLTPSRTASDHQSQSARSSYRDWELRSPFGLARGMADHMIAGPARRSAEDLLPHLRSALPDRVVCSFTAFGAMVAAQSVGVPFDVLIPNIYPMPAPGQPPMGMGLTPSRTFVGRGRDRLLGELSTRMLGHYVMPRLNALRRDLDLPQLRNPWEQVHGARRELVLSSRAFDFANSCGSSVRYVGPMLEDPGWAKSQPSPEPRGDGPLVLVAMSSAEQGQLRVLQNTIDALSEMPVRVVVTTGLSVDPYDLSGGDRVEIVRSASHRDLMAHAALVITHGGHGTVMKSLIAGLPMVILPQGRDQADNAVRVSLRGAGITLPRNASSGQITNAVVEVLTLPGYSKAARVLGAVIRQEAAGGDLVSELET